MANYNAEDENMLGVEAQHQATLAEELKRLIGEYQDDDAGESTKAEAWNLIADFTVENSKAILRSLSTPTASGSGEARPIEGLRLIERDDDALICAPHWQGYSKALARRPALMSNEDWRPIANRIIAALSPCRIGEETEEAKPIAIKPLEWEQDASGNWFAPTSFGQRYYIYQNSDGQFAVSFGGSVQMAGDVEGGKVVAQVDFESRLRSSLSRKTAGEAEPVAWRWRLPSDPKWQFTDGPEKPTLGLPTSFEASAIKDAFASPPLPDTEEKGIGR